MDPLLQKNYVLSHIPFYKYTLYKYWWHHHYIRIKIKYETKQKTHRNVYEILCSLKNISKIHWGNIIQFLALFSFSFRIRWSCFFFSFSVFLLRSSWACFFFSFLSTSSLFLFSCSLAFFAFSFSFSFCRFFLSLSSSFVSSLLKLKTHFNPQKLLQKYSISSYHEL